MDGELVRYLYHELFRSCKAPPRGCVFSDEVILFIYFLAVASDRSVLWAHDRRHWPLWARRLPRPSYSQLMRRLKSDTIQERIRILNATLRDRLPRASDKYLDGKPLVVGVFTRDPDVAWGKLSNDTWARGYKLHLVFDAAGVVEAAQVTPLNGSESITARALVEFMNLSGALVRADSSYDSNALYQAIAQRGGRLIAPRKKPGRGLGHHPQHPHRLQAIQLLEGSSEARTIHRRLRIRVEQGLAHMTNLPFGLAPLPNWVRRLERVRRWVLAKISLYHLHLNLRLCNTNVA